jgi:hypothetical protein
MATIRELRGQICIKANDSSTLVKISKYLADKVKYNSIFTYQPISRNTDLELSF